MDLETKRQSTQALLESAELLFTEAECRAALQKVADAISHDLSDKYPLLLPVMGGAVVFTGQLLPLLRFPLDFDYVHVSRYGDKLQGGNFNWLRMPNPEQIAGRHVVILDDILDEGHTMAAISEKLLEVLRCPLKPMDPNHQWIKEALCLKYPEPLDAVISYLQPFGVEI